MQIGHQESVNHTMTYNDFNRRCEELLARYSDRNNENIRRHIEGLCAVLRREGNAVEAIYGGSVSRGTDVNGISDVDILLVVNQSSLINQPPSRVINYVRETLERHLPFNSIRAGNLAVTVRYADDIEIQILPAIRTNTNGFRIAQPGSTQWSNIVLPDRFAARLVEINRRNNGRVVLTIKLAKAIADCFITKTNRKISGYHMEALAIKAFENYQGPQDSKNMLVHLFGNSMTDVLTPIRDSTGQSIAVDEYLGEGGSRLRKGAETHFGQMRGMINSCRNASDFDSLFCL